jgi:hypothetical protein
MLIYLISHRWSACFVPMFRVFCEKTTDNSCDGSFRFLQSWLLRIMETIPWWYCGLRMEEIGYKPTQKPRWKVSNHHQTIPTRTLLEQANLLPLHHVFHHAIRPSGDQRKIHYPLRLERVSRQWVPWPLHYRSKLDRRDQLPCWALLMWQAVDGSYTVFIPNALPEVESTQLRLHFRTDLKFQSVIFQLQERSQTPWY